MSARPRVAPSASVSPVVASAPRPWPGVACNDARAPANLRFFACTTDCDARDGQACEALGDLHAKEEGLPQPDASAGAALRAWEKGCALGTTTACQRHDSLLAALVRACDKAPQRGCRPLGSALRNAGKRDDADKAFDRACTAGNAQACFERGELHGAWEPAGDHRATSETLFLRACNLGSGEGCCAMESIYRARGETKKLEALLKRAQAIVGFGCGSG